MDKRKKYYIVVDTETCNGLITDNKLDLSQSLVYNIGWQVIDKKGNVYIQKSYLVSEIFCSEPLLMNSAYYADKISNYLINVKEGRCTIDTFYNIRMDFLRDFEYWNIAAIVAHNAKFDYNALNNTQRWLTKSKYRYFFPYGVPLYDTMNMALDTFGQEKSYQSFCLRYGFMTNHRKPRPRVTAEILYKYISGNYDFVESHTGLEDVIIESMIFVECLKKHKKMRRSTWNKK